jgi:hypothetical protein
MIGAWGDDLVIGWQLHGQWQQSSAAAGEIAKSIRSFVPLST